MKNILIIFLIFQQSLALAQGSANTGTVKIIVHTVFGTDPLKLQSLQYINAHGDSLYIDEFRFYISNLKFSDAAISSHEVKSYHLVDASDHNTQVIYVKGIAAGNYTNLRFILGVDSLANVSGANDGDLDPVKAMYWAWNTGYIMAKLQGRSNVCKTLHHAFEFHIGGYQPPYNTVRTVNLPLQDFAVRAGKETVLNINADAAAWFESPRTINLSEINEVNMPCKNAMMMADNYSDMFSVVQQARGAKK